MVPAMRWSMTRALGSALVSGLAASLAIACSSTPPPVVGTTHGPPAASATAAPSAPEGPPLLPAKVIAELDESAAPIFVRRGDDGLLLFSAGGRWLTRVFSADGTAKTPDAIDVAAALADAQFTTVKPTSDGYLLVWAEPVARNRAVKLLALDTAGKARGEPALVAQIADELAWADVLPNAKGALVLWQVLRDNTPDVMVVPVSNAGKVEGAQSVIAHDAIGWQAIATERGAAIATVLAGALPAPAAAKPGRKNKGNGLEALADQRGTKLGRVVLTEIDAKGKPGTPVVVSGEGTAQLDVQIGEVGGRYLVAWTDERNIDACVYVAAVEPGGKIAVAPHRATAPFGEQALVSLVATPYTPGGAKGKRALLAWEDQLRVSRDGRLLHLATLGADGALAKERAALAYSAAGAPDVVPDGEGGFAALTLAPIKDLPEGVLPPVPEGRKNEVPVLPSFVRFGADLDVIAAEPLRAEPFAKASQPYFPYLTRGLFCSAGKCGAVASGAGAAAPLALVDLPNRKGPWKIPAMREADEAPPRPSSVTALFDGEHLSKVAAAQIAGGGTIVGWVTYQLEAAARVQGSGKKNKAPPPKDDDGPLATLGVRPISADGTPGKTVVISRKARSIGGVALAAAPAPDGKKAETAVAWVAREKGEFQVFVTKVGPDGEKLAQKGVTVIARKKRGGEGVPSEVSDVAIAYAGGGDGNDGWVVSWVDTRDGNAEIYVAKVDRALTKIVPDKRVTSAPGDSAEVQIAVRGKDVFLVWSDARANVDEGTGDIYAARLDLATLKKTGPEMRLFSSASHSRTPQISAAGKGFLVSWIEEGAADAKPDAQPGAEHGLRIAELDDKGALVGAPELVRGDGQTPVSSAALVCEKKFCRGVITSVVSEARVLGAFELTAGKSPGPVKTIATLSGGVTQDVSPSFSSATATSLFFADDAVGGTGRVRWMQIAWP